MQDTQHILVVVDSKETRQPALERAAELGRRVGAELTVMSVAYSPEQSFGLFNWADQDVGRLRQEQLNREHARLQGLIDAEGITANVKAVWGHPFDEAVNDAVSAYGADLLVLQPRDLDAGRLSHAEWRLLGRCPVPIWLARRSQWSEHPRLLASVDPSHSHDKPASLDNLILSATKAVADAWDVNFHVLHALGATPSGISVAQPAEQYETELRSAREKRVRALLDSELESRVEIHLPAHDAERSLREACEEHHLHLVVMGILARSRIEDFLVGNTARKFLPQSRCDVLLIKP